MSIDPDKITTQEETGEQAPLMKWRRVFRPR
jgi:hypothetical protein